MLRGNSPTTNILRTLSEAIKTDTTSIRATLLPLQATIEAIQNDTVSIKVDTRNISGTQHRDRYHEALEWLSSTDYPAQQQDIISRRQEATAQWFLDSPEFREWSDGSAKVLFCPGIPGAGKTMMTAVAIEHLLNSLSSGDVGIAYIFSSYKAQHEQGVGSLMASLVKQLAWSCSETMTAVVKLFEQHSKRGRGTLIDELGSMLAAACGRCSTVYIIVDALDECPSTVRSEFVEKLYGLQAKGNTRLLFTSRSIPEVTSSFQNEVQLEVRANEDDVKRYVKGNISRFAKCVRANETLQVEVQNKIAEAADGM